jgi:hypothetical protein
VAAPEFVPVDLEDLPRTKVTLPAPANWRADRPGDLHGSQPLGPKLGRPGPDQGYALKLADDCFRDRLVLASGEHPDDAIAGCVAVGLKRASMYGRAPVIYDLELAFTLWGYFEGAPPELVAFRRTLFEAACHHYSDQREIVDLVPDTTLQLTPAQVRERLSDWKSLLLDS